MGVWIMHQRAAAKHGEDRNLTTERKALLEGVSGWTWEQEKEKKFSDTCPNCNCTIEFDKASAKDLDHTHDDGKGDKCRFRGTVVGGKAR